MKTHHFSRNVKALRKSRGLTQVELSELSGVSQPTISDIERGRVSRVSHVVVASLAESLGLSSLELFSKISKSAIAKYRAADIV